MAIARSLFGMNLNGKNWKRKGTSICALDSTCLIYYFLFLLFDLTNVR